MDRRDAVLLQPVVLEFCSVDRCDILHKPLAGSVLIGEALLERLGVPPSCVAVALWRCVASHDY